MEVIFLLILAIFPSVGFLIYILYMDRNEREPLDLVLKTIFLGAIFAIPAALVELIISVIFPFFEDKDFTSIFFQAFVQVAFIEEVCKIAPVLLFVWKNPEFNEENDGIVYTGASALGFATLENIFYVLAHGWSVGILRAISSIPLHCFTGVIAGYFIGLAKFSSSIKESRKKILTGFLIAYLFHAFYDAFALSETLLAVFVIPTVILIWVFGINLLKRGRNLSLARWGVTLATSSEDFSKETKEKLKLDTNLGKWKIWVSRTIFSILILFWVFLIIGIIVNEDPTLQTREAIIGGIVISVLPVIIGILLEISYLQSNA